jgi:alpha-L-arabinofuranosidase
VGTWVTEAEFEDVRVNGQPVALVPELGKWSVSGASLHQQDASGDKMLGPAFLAFGGNPKASNYTLTLRARKLSGVEGFLIPFYVRSKDDYCWWNLGGWGNTQYQIERSVNGTKTGLVRPNMMASIETGRWYAIKLECKGPHIKAYLDNKLVHDVTIP